LRPAAEGSPLLSLDVLLGATMAAMVIVNSHGDSANVFWPFRRAEWDGWTPADLILPQLLFLVGAAIPLSRRNSGWRAILRRGLLTITAGLLLSGFPAFDVSRWRIPGVLQRIGICYLAAAGAYRATSGDSRRRGAILMSAGVFLTLAYWLVMQHVPPPGGVAGDLSPEGNLGAYIDRALMGRHLWNRSWDPEGLLSTVPAIATTLFGVVCGICLESAESPRRKVRHLASAGVGGIIGGQMWGVVFPINPSLWSSSFAVFSAGVASLVLAACYWAVDVKGWRGWTRPLAVLGSNALTLYVLSSVLQGTLASISIDSSDGRRIPAGQLAYVRFFAPVASPETASLLYAFVSLLLLSGLLVWMYRRRVLIRL
jgi:predicted acyltransferase